MAVKSLTEKSRAMVKGRTVMIPIAMVPHIARGTLRPGSGSSSLMCVAESVQRNPEEDG